jgi:hypothetical protein
MKKTPVYYVAKSIDMQNREFFLNDLKRTGKFYQKILYFTVFFPELWTDFDQTHIGQKKSNFFFKSCLKLNTLCFAYCNRQWMIIVCAIFVFTFKYCFGFRTEFTARCRRRMQALQQRNIFPDGLLPH